MNNATIIGRLTKDVELRTTKDGMSVASLTIAVPRQYKNDETDFISCKAFRERADILQKYTKKGDLLAVSGSIRTGSYEKEDGTKIYTTDLIVENIKFLQPKEQTESSEQPSYESYKAEDIIIDDDDLPF